MAKLEYSYRDNFNKTFTSLVSEIVYYHLRSNKIKLIDLVKQLNEKGFKISYSGLRSSLDNRNISCYNYVYWSRIFEHLNIAFNQDNFIKLYLDAKQFNIEYLIKRKKKL